jgi:hypothetical protein
LNCRGIGATGDELLAKSPDLNFQIFTADMLAATQMRGNLPSFECLLRYPGKGREKNDFSLRLDLPPTLDRGGEAPRLFLDLPPTLDRGGEAPRLF